MMKDREIRIIENALLAANRPLVRVLEWGCGGSTAYFPGVLARHGITYRWLSIEHDKEWFLSMSGKLKDSKHVELSLFETAGENPRDPACKMDEYVSFPSTLGMTFDMILVDGRKRRRCLLEAKRLLAPGGVVFLHDAHRKRYHCALAEYPDSCFLTRDLWRGSNEKLPGGTRSWNKIRSLFHLHGGKFREK
jgi:SAM-dependent methyltransferase